MIIRKATYSDARRIGYLIRKNADKVLSKVYSTEQLLAWKNYNTPATIRSYIKQREIFCAFENNFMIGTIGLEGCIIKGLYVSHNKIGKGVGFRLLLFLEQYAIENNIKELTLYATPIGLDFYLRQKYKPCGIDEIYINDVKFFETKMKKKLT